MTQQQQQVRSIFRQANEEAKPIREQFQWSIPFLLLLVSIGAILLRVQITPLVSKLLRSEREATDRELRIRTVVDNVGEGIITLDLAAVKAKAKKGSKAEAPQTVEIPFNAIEKAQLVAEI